MDERGILSALVGWKCPCCGMVLSPTTSSCVHCSPRFLREAFERLSPGNGMTYHDCPPVQLRTKK